MIALKVMRQLQWKLLGSEPMHLQQEDNTLDSLVLRIARQDSVASLKIPSAAEMGTNMKKGMQAIVCFTCMKREAWYTSGQGQPFTR